MKIVNYKPYIYGTDEKFLQLFKKKKTKSLIFFDKDIQSFSLTYLCVGG